MNLELKVLEFHQIDNGKLRVLLGEVDNLKKEIVKLKKDNESLKLENDFLNRTNFKLKKEIENENEKKIKSNK